MKRTYLEEDLELIRRYFPGADAVAIRTPFDLTQRDCLPRRHTESSRDYDDVLANWRKEVVWTN